MSAEILINSTRGLDRVALVENGLLQEFWQEQKGNDSCVGSIFVGVVSRVVPGLQAAFIEIGLERNGFLHVTNMLSRKPSNESGETPAVCISRLLHEGQSIIVQVIKDPLGSKGARLSTQLSIASRFMVLVPNGNSVAVSVRIKDEVEKIRLKESVMAVASDYPGHGFIVRTNAEGVDQFGLAADMSFLVKVWRGIEERKQTAGKGACLYQDLSLPVRTLRDFMHKNIEKVRIDQPKTLQQVQQFTEGFLPEWSERIELYEEDRPLFDLYGVENEINAALQREVRLKSGGLLVFDQTEAMTTIDVNSGSFTGKNCLEDTIFKTNLEATHTIARQLRLRNIGGIIMIDFIDMQNPEHQRSVMRGLKNELEKDMVKTSVSEPSNLGLVEMTRKRSSESLEHRLCIICPNCSGRGTIKSSVTVCWEIMREIMRTGRNSTASKLKILASPLVVAEMLEDHAELVEEMEETLDKSICFQNEDHYSQEQFDVVLL